MKRWLPWAALGIVVVIAMSVVVARSGPSADPEARAQRLERRLACPVCTGESIADSNAPESRAIKTDLRERIEAGQSDAQIVAYYVGIYGEDTDRNPPDDGIGLIAWGLPVVVLVGGAAGIAIALRRWSSEPRLTATAEDEDVVRHAREAQPHEDH